MTARELHSLLAKLSGSPEGEIDQRTRALREHNLIPHGGRGVNAPEIEPVHAAYIIACLAARRASDGVMVAVKATALLRVPGPKFVGSDLMPLGVAIAMAVEMGEQAISRIEIAADGTFAWVDCAVPEARERWQFEDARLVRAKAPETLREKRELADDTCGHTFVLGAGAIQAIHATYHNARNAQRRADRKKPAEVA